VTTVDLLTRHMGMVVKVNPLPVQNIAGLAWLLVRVNADHVQGTLVNNL